MRLAVLLFAILFSVATSFAVGPTTMTYQAIFTDNSGEIMPDGVYNIGFHIFESPVGGPPLWSEWQDVTVTNGLFEITLGVINPLAVVHFADILGDGTWLGLSYNEDFLNPRQFITGVPYAFIACYADTARKAALADEATHAANATLFNGVSLFEFISMLDFVSFEQLDNNDVALDPNQAVTRNSNTFTVTRESIVYYYATVSGLSDPSICCGRGDLRVRVLNSFDQVIDQSALISSANPGGLHAQAFTTSLPAGTYYLQVELINTSAVTHESIEFGAFYQGN